MCSFWVNHMEEGRGGGNGGHLFISLKFSSTCSMLLSDLWTERLTFVRISPSAQLLSFSSAMCPQGIWRTNTAFTSIYLFFFNVQHVFIIFSHGKKKSLRGINVWQISQPWRKKLNSAKRYYIDINNNISSITKDCDAVNMNKSNVGMGFFLFFFFPLQTALRNTFRLLLHMWNLLTRSLQRPAITR